MSGNEDPSRKPDSPISPKQDPTETNVPKCSPKASSSRTTSSCTYCGKDRETSEKPGKKVSLATMNFGMSSNCEEAVQRCARLCRAASLDENFCRLVPKDPPKEKVLRDYRAAMFSFASRDLSMRGDRAIKTDESDQSDDSDKSNQSPPGPPKNKIAKLTKPPKSKPSSSGEENVKSARTSSSPPIDNTRPLSMLSMRSSEERLNLEVEHIVMKNRLSDEERFATPDGRRAPLNELLGNRPRSLDSALTPQDMIDSPRSSASSPEQNGAKGGSPKINKFVARAPPTGGPARVSIQLERYPITPRPIRLRPSDGSAFQRLRPVSQVSSDMQTDQVAPEGPPEADTDDEEL